MRAHEAEFSFYGDLLDFVDAGVVIRCFVNTSSVKDMIEALGVPHPEAGLVVVNGVPVAWDYLVADGDRISVYPRFRSLAVASDSPIHWAGEARFVLDCHLGRLARYLRLLGFDAVHRPDFTDEEIAELARSEDRIVLTRDVGVLKRSTVRRGRFVRQVRPLAQAVEVVGSFGLSARIVPFARCMVCNGILQTAERGDIERRVPPEARRRHEDFRQCSTCGRVYWKGSHYPRLERIIEAVRKEAAPQTPPA